MRKILEACPTCDARALVVTELGCPHCGTTVRARYRPTIFSRLGEADLRFLEIFVKNRGNVKEMERELEVSYWTIRSRLDDVIAALGFGDGEGLESPIEAPSGAEQARQRQELLDALEAGEITVAEAAERLDAL